MLTVIVSSLYLFSSGKEKLAQTVAMICWSSSLSSGNDRTVCISVFFFFFRGSKVVETEKC